MEENKEHSGQAGKTAILIVAVVAVIFALLAGFGGLTVLGSLFDIGNKVHFYEGTTIDGIDVSKKSLKGAAEALSDAAKDYSINIIFRDEELTVDGSEINLQYNTSSDLQSVKDQQNAVLSSDTTQEQLALTAEDIYIFDKTKLEDMLKALDALDTAKMTAPVNAKLLWDDDAKSYYLEDQDAGNTLDPDKLIEAVEAAVAAGQTMLDVDEAGLYETAALTAESENAQNVIDTANAYASVSLRYTFRDGKTAKISGKRIRSFLGITKAGEVGIKKKKVTAYVEKLIAKHDPEENYTQFETTSGKIIELYIPTGGIEIEKDSLVADIMNCIKNGTSGEREAAYKELTDGVDNNFDGNYIEVDIENQMVYLYKNGRLIISTPCVTGCVSEGHSTPAGVYKIQNMMRDTTLVGDDYESDVSYWMPFNGGVGLHDASWRSYFGGDIYYYNGSHGCVNLSYSAAEKIYSNISIGYRVIVHNGSEKVDGQVTKEETETESETETAETESETAQTSADEDVSSQE